MLVGIVATAFIARDDVGRLSFDLLEIAESANFSTGAGRWLFAALTIAFAVKVPLFPLHTWLPDAHTQAPTAGSVILAGVLLKMGTYGLIRFGLYLFPEAAVWSRPVLLTLAVIGILYGAIAATMQKDLKRLVAYSSVAHLGFIVLGTFAITSQALVGSVVQMVNHGVSTGALFLLVGMIYERRHTRRGFLHRRDVVFDWAPGPEWFRRRVPGLDRVLWHCSLVGGHRNCRCGVGCPVFAVGIPAGVPW